ncbi:hypothetical protein ACN2C6_10890 [Caulobacter sp. ErkDOM-YI]|uniref:hypothetical protein n=1 Tax=unclassified Caulobacter TaxID=2648921 RepID=UPI003AF77622
MRSLSTLTLASHYASLGVTASISSISVLAPSCSTEASSSLSFSTSPRACSP